MLLRHQAYGEAKHWVRMFQGEKPAGLVFRVPLVDDNFRLHLVKNFNLDELIKTVVLTEVSAFVRHFVGHDLHLFDIYLRRTAL